MADPNLKVEKPAGMDPVLSYSLFYTLVFFLVLLIGAFGLIAEF